jgi:hypothetical protein
MAGIDRIDFVGKRTLRKIQQHGSANAPGFFGSANHCHVFRREKRIQSSSRGGTVRRDVPNIGNGSKRHNGSLTQDKHPKKYQ